MSINPRTWVAAGASVLLIGCGNALVPGELATEPLFTISGEIDADRAGPDLAKLDVGLVWIDPLGVLDDRPSPPAESSGAVSADGKAFRLDVWMPPPQEIIRRIPDPGEPDRTAFAFALAEIVAFDDGDGNGAFRVEPRANGSHIAAPDRYRGVAKSHAFFYVDQAFVARDSTPIEELYRIVKAGGYRLANAVCANDDGHFEGGTNPVGILLVDPQATVPQNRACLGSAPADAP